MRNALVDLWPMLFILLLVIRGGELWNGLTIPNKSAWNRKPELFAGDWLSHAGIVSWHLDCSKFWLESWCAGDGWEVSIGRLHTFNALVCAVRKLVSVKMFLLNLIIPFTWNLVMLCLLSELSSMCFQRAPWYWLRQPFEFRRTDCWLISLL